jgi:hypothetical protein
MLSMMTMTQILILVKEISKKFLMTEDKFGKVLNLYVYNKNEDFYALSRYQPLGIFDILCTSHGLLGNWSGVFQ